jgi:hypothetical protein
MQVTGEDFAKGFVGILFAGLLGAVSWLLGTVLGHRDSITKLTMKVETLEADMKKAKEEQVTRECVREEIENALEKRDKLAETKRMEYARLRKLETKEIIDEKLEQLIPRIAHEIKGNLLGHRLTPKPPSSPDEE